MGVCFSWEKIYKNHPQISLSLKQNDNLIQYHVMCDELMIILYLIKYQSRLLFFPKIFSFEINLSLFGKGYCHCLLANLFFLYQNVCLFMVNFIQNPQCSVPKPKFLIMQGFKNCFWEFLICLKVLQKEIIYKFF